MFISRVRFSFCSPPHAAPGRILPGVVASLTAFAPYRRIGDANPFDTYNLPIFMEFAGKPKPRAPSYRRIVCKGMDYSSGTVRGKACFILRSNPAAGGGVSPLHHLLRTPVR